MKKLAKLKTDVKKKFKNTGRKCVAESKHVFYSATYYASLVLFKKTK